MDPSDRADTLVAKFIRAARKKMKLTLEQFGTEFGRTKGNVHAWEQGLHEPAFLVLVEISNRSGLSLPGLTAPATGTLISEAMPPYFESRLEQSLHTIGKAIAEVPVEHRQELADDMHQWALYGGREKHRQAVAESIQRRDDLPNKRSGT